MSVVRQPVVQHAEVVAVRPPAFLIVGTWRSGTTLVQRLASELDGVRVPPETHFLRFAIVLLKRRSFPLDAIQLREELGCYLDRKTSNGLQVDIERVIAAMEGRCNDIWQLFAALVGHLAGPARIPGEKTPDHLRWWRPITTRFPELRLVCVVREPRSVVASNLTVPFAPRSHVILAERWRADQREVRSASAELGPKRCLVLRYEDVVRDPGAATERLAALLGTRLRSEQGGSGPALFHEWEWWKRRALGPVTTDRIDAWKEVLSQREATDVQAICREEMALCGYEALPSRGRAFARRVALPPRQQWRRGRFRFAAHRERTWIRKVLM